MEVLYNKKIHRMVMDILEQKEKEKRYEKDCFNANICAICGSELNEELTHRSKFRYYKVCSNKECKFIAGEA